MPFLTELYFEMLLLFLGTGISATILFFLAGEVVDSAFGNAHSALSFNGKTSNSPLPMINCPKIENVPCRIA
ncbi:MAG: hypothetical protein RBS55_05150 [Bacteroidales bacterium]|nr:hypothetical protein [Bacteroidales bacterium]